MPRVVCVGSNTTLLSRAPAETVKERSLSILIGCLRVETDVFAAE